MRKIDWEKYASLYATFQIRTNYRLWWWNAKILKKWTSLDYQVYCGFFWIFSLFTSRCIFLNLSCLISSWMPYCALSFSWFLTCIFSFPLHFSLCFLPFIFVEIFVFWGKGEGTHYSFHCSTKISFQRWSKERKINAIPVQISNERKSDVFFFQQEFRWMPHWNRGVFHWSKYTNDESFVQRFFWL